MGSDNIKGINTVTNNPNQINLAPNKGPKGHKIALVGAIIVLAAFLIFVFASYEGYLPFLKISSSSNPYFSVANVQQLSSTVSKLSNSSGPFNLSYSFLLSLSADAGSSTFSYNLPINGYIAHYTPYSKETADISLGTLIKDIETLHGTTNSSFPKFLYNINITALSNSSYENLCIPFTMLSSATNQNLSEEGSEFNDSSVNNDSLFCLSLKNSNLTSLSNSTSLLNISSVLNSSNLSQFSNYLQVKYIKSDTYNGDGCSLLDMNTTAAFESKYNFSMGFSFCFSNSYGIPLYGNLMLNLTKDSAEIMQLFNPTGNLSSLPNFSNIILSASLKSAFNPVPSSSSIISTLPKGSYLINQTLLSKMIFAVEHLSGSPSITVKTPKALLSYVDSYIPGMVFSSNLSAGYGGYAFYLNSPKQGIFEVFSYSPTSAYNNFSELYTSFLYLPSKYNITIDGQPAVGSNYTSTSDYSYQFYTMYKGGILSISAYAPLNTSYLTELNNTILKMVESLPLQDIS